MLPINPDCPVLVTGLHRSGTTLLGKVLEWSGEFRMTTEPLNRDFGCVGIKHWYPGWQDGSASIGEDVLERAVRGWIRYRRIRKINELKRWKTYPRLIVGSGSERHYLKGRLLHAHKRALIKDPFAAFLAGFFIQRLGGKVIASVKHPCAFYVSLMRMGWVPLSEEGQCSAGRQGDTFPTESIREVSLLWRAVYAALIKVQRDYPSSLYFSVNETLSAEPDDEVVRLFDFLNLDCDVTVRDRLRRLTRAKQAVTQEQRALHVMDRDAVKSAWRWRSLLSPEEVDALHEQTADIASHFYPECDWHVERRSEYAG